MPCRQRSGKCSATLSSLASCSYSNWFALVPGVVCVCVSVCLSVCLFVCMYVYLFCAFHVMCDVWLMCQLPAGIIKHCLKYLLEQQAEEDSIDCLVKLLETCGGLSTSLFFFLLFFCCSSFRFCTSWSRMMSSSS